MSNKRMSRSEYSHRDNDVVCYIHFFIITFVHLLFYVLLFTIYYTFVLYVLFFFFLFFLLFFLSFKQHDAEWMNSSAPVVRALVRTQDAMDVTIVPIIPTNVIATVHFYFFFPF